MVTFDHYCGAVSGWSFALAEGWNVQLAGLESGRWQGRTFEMRETDLVASMASVDYLATMASGMTDIEERTPIPDGFWEYVDAIPVEDEKRFSFEGADISVAKRSRDQRYDHVLLGSATPDVFMVIVIDREARTILGHHLLDLPALYGLGD